jgi:hypothetical protein
LPSMSLPSRAVGGAHWRSGGNGRATGPIALGLRDAPGLRYYICRGAIVPRRAAPGQ